MESESHFISRQLKFFTATLYAQIKLNTRDGLTDLPKSQEISLLQLINLAFDTDFEDLNRKKQNYPGVDYGSISMKTGLQMTATVKKKKFSDTLDIYDRNTLLKQSFPNVWFFLLTVEPIPESVKLTVPNIKYITLFDMQRRVLDQDITFQVEFINQLKKEYGRYFESSKSKVNTFLLPETVDIPTDMLLFNEFIATEQWFPEDPGTGYLKIYDLISAFANDIRKCTIKAREILVSMIQLAPPPQEINDKIVVYADHVYGSLNINENNIASYDYNKHLLEINDLIEEIDDFIGFRYEGDDVYFEVRKQYVLNYRIFEPELNLFSAMYIFFSKNHNLNEFKNAILNCDFSLLSDSVF